MEENSTSSVKTITLLFISGAVLGTVAGILCAPKSGKETRKEIQALRDEGEKGRGQHRAAHEGRHRGGP